jgi:hypothetical protein
VAVGPVLLGQEQELPLADRLAALDQRRAGREPLDDRRHGLAGAGASGGVLLERRRQPFDCLFPGPLRLRLVLQLEVGADAQVHRTDLTNAVRKRRSPEVNQQRGGHHGHEDNG